MTHATGNQKAHQPVPITADLSVLTPNDQQVLRLLLEAAKLIDLIYLKQSNQKNTTATDWVFDAEQPKDFYPLGTTVDSIEQYLKEHPEDAPLLRHPCTVITEIDGALRAIPYATYYREEMSAIAELLRKAADLTQTESLRRFLFERSDAFFSNQYRASDIAWIYTNGPIEITIGPYEDYADSVLGVKRTFEAIIGIVLEKETSLAATFKDSIQEFDAILGQRYGYTAQTNLTPMLVIDQVFASGEAIYDYVPMAYNLPNDRDIHEEVGSKKVFLRNVMEAKFSILTKAIAIKVLQSENYIQFDSMIYLQHVIGHEASHGLTFRFDGADFGPISSTLEEAKADVFGMWFLYYLVEQGVLEQQVADTAVMQNLTDGLRQIRFGAAEAHGAGAALQLNWFIEARALLVTEYGLDFDPSLFRTAMESLGDTLYNLSQTRDPKQAKKFTAKWCTIPPKVEQLLPRFTNIPIDIDPIFSV